MLKNHLILFVTILASSLTFAQISVGPGVGFVNNGSFSVQGDYVNNGIVQTGTGSKVYFNGTSPQRIYGTSTTNFGSMIVDNPTNINIETEVNIFDDVLFLDGYVEVADASSNAVLRFNADTATHSGASELRYVKGWVEKVGSSDFTFPVGDIELQRISISGLTSAATFRTRYLRQKPQDSTNIQNCLDHIGTNEFWDLDRIVGSSEAEVTLEWDTVSGIVRNINAMAVARYGSSGPPIWSSEGSRNVTGAPARGSVTSGAGCSGAGSGSLASFGRFALASFTNENTLPVNLLTFSAKVEGDFVKLDWTTLSEQRNAFFKIESSVDGKKWEKVGVVNSKDPNSKKRLDYDLYDYSPYKGGVSYYRLSQYDVDGSEHVYNDRIRTVFIIEKSVVKVYPNPARDYLMIESSEKISLNDISFVDAVGRVVSLPFVSGIDNSIECNISSLSAGVYFVRIVSNEGDIVTKKIVKR